MKSKTPLRIVLVTIGFGGTCLYVEREGNCTSTIRGYGREDWRKYLEPGKDHIVPADTPVVDCTVEGCDTVTHAVKGPMFSQRLADDQFHELGSPAKTWKGERLSGIAECGLAPYIAHALMHGCSVTHAGTGEPYPVPELTPEGSAPARNQAIALGMAVDPEATIEAVMLHQFEENL